MVFVESAGDFGLASPPQDPKFNERGFALWASFVSRYVVSSHHLRHTDIINGTDIVRAMKIRNMSIDPGAHLIPDLLKANAAVENVTVVEKNLPMTPWSDGASDYESLGAYEHCSYLRSVAAQGRVSALYLRTDQARLAEYYY